MIDFAKYAKIKDNYCLCYFGPNEEYLIQLKLLKPTIEARFPGIRLGFGCRDELAHLFGPEHAVMRLSEIKVKREEFGHVNEIRFNNVTHPVEDFLDECGVEHRAIPRQQRERSAKCVIVTKGHYPTKNLEVAQIERLTRTAKGENYQIDVDGDVHGAGLVMGVESRKLFEAAQRGTEVRLVPTGLGTRLYKQCFPDLIVLHT